MKKNLLSLALLLSLTFILSGLQTSLYFLPVPMPAFWFIILTYYSFRKSILFTLCLNLFMVFAVAAFSSTGLTQLILIMNLMSFTMSSVKERFHTTSFHISVAAAIGSLVFFVLDWAIICFNKQFFYPPLLTWVGQSVMTFIFSPAIIYCLDLVDTQIHTERVDTLQNLRI